MTIIFLGSALASRLAGIKSPFHIAFFGAGLQILHHAKMLLALYSKSLKSCSIINRSVSGRTSNLVQLLGVHFPDVAVDVIVLSDSDRIRDSVSRADIICTATPSKMALFEESWLKPNVHLNLVRHPYPILSSLLIAYLFPPCR